MGFRLLIIAGKLWEQKQYPKSEFAAEHLANLSLRANFAATDSATALRALKVLLRTSDKCDRPKAEILCRRGANHLPIPKE